MAPEGPHGSRRRGVYHRAALRADPLAPPHHGGLRSATICELLRFNRKRNPAALLRPINTTGKSPKVCPPLRAKIFRLTRRANQWFESARLTRTRGGSRSSRTCGGMRWTRELRLTSVTRADGEVVW